MLEFIRCKRIGTIFIVKLAGEGYFTASTFEFTGAARLYRAACGGMMGLASYLRT
jgi:hypothetical protein